MLSISKPRSASGAASYYLHMEKDSMGQVGEYYAQEGEAGYWMGNGANRLGLGGQVQGRDFEALAKGFDQHGEKLMQNAGDPNRRAGWDLTFSAPKSVSVAWGIGDATTRETIEKAHAEAVREAFNVMQTNASFARTGAQGEDLARCELVAAAFQHGSSREQDAQLHTHVFVFNSGLIEGRDAASIESKLMFDYKMASGAAYQCALAEQLGRAGYVLERDGPDSFRIAAIPRELEAEQSTRRVQIEAELARTGQTSAAASEKANLATRSAKQEVPIAELRQRWTEQAAAHGITPEKVQPGLGLADVSKARNGILNDHQERASHGQNNHQHNHQQRADKRQDNTRQNLARGLRQAQRAIQRAVHQSHGRGTSSPRDFGRLQGVRALDDLRKLPGVDLDKRDLGFKRVLSSDERHRLVELRAAHAHELRRAADLNTAEAWAKGAAPPTGRDVLEKATERDAIITKADILRESYRQHITVAGTSRAERIAGVAQRQAVAVERTDGEKARTQQYTSRDLMKAERQVVSIADARRHETHQVIGLPAVTAACARTSDTKGYALSPEQRVAVERLCCDPGGVKIMIGDAGTGKSSTLHAVREAYEGGGMRVLGTSAGGKASAELMASSGIESRSIARLNADLAAGKEVLTDRTVLVIDEAGMTGSRDMHKLIGQAAEVGAKVILVGDHKQLQPVGAGETLRALDKELGSARLTSIVRQNEVWERGAVKDLSQGDAAKALKEYAEQGRIHVDNTYKAAIKDVAERHVENIREVGAEKTISIAGTRQAVDHINEAVRDALKKDGQLKDAQKYTTQDQHKNSGERELELAKGDRVMFNSGNPGEGYTNGDGGRVVAKDKDTVSIKLDRTGETVQLNPKDAELRHGYAITTHKSQGSTYDRATVYLDSNTSREMSYVQASRAKESTHFVASSQTVRELRSQAEPPQKLREAVADIEQRRTAAGKDSGLEKGEKLTLQRAVDYVKDNKDYATKEHRAVAKEAQTVASLASAMSRSKPKENTLSYRERDNPAHARGDTRSTPRSFEQAMRVMDREVAAARAERSQAGQGRTQERGGGMER